VGGYSHSTLSEDCDITLAVHKAGYRVIQDNTAITYTEAPSNITGLSKQRFRWIFGNIQSFWKHRDMLFNGRYGWIGFFVLPNAILSILLPLIFGPILFVVALGNILDGNGEIVLLFFALTITIQFIFALTAIILARERLSHILALPLTRLIYFPLRSYLLYRSVGTAFKGAYVGWNKLSRTGSVKSLPEPTQKMPA
jgi:biofilm PGA synthesis N-glycosyltransferase PgaC